MKECKSLKKITNDVKSVIHNLIVDQPNFIHSNISDKLLRDYITGYKDKQHTPKTMLHISIK